MLRLVNIAGLAISAVLVVSGFVGAFTEITPYVTLYGTDSKQLVRLMSGRDRPGLSLGSKTLFLRECAALTSSPVTRVHRASERAEVLETCHRIAQSVAEQLPTSGEAWLVMALTSIGRGDEARFNAELISSRIRSANVHWLAAERVKMSETHFNVLDEANRKGHLRDLHALTESHAGIVALAEDYVARPLARDRIIAIMETAHSTSQAEFLGLVRLQSGAENGN